MVMPSELANIGNGEKFKETMVEAQDLSREAS